MPKNQNPIVIVGAGVGGLATALRLAHQGRKVHVHEKLPECGGRAHMIEDQGFKIDTGPSFVLMPDFFEEVFEYCGEDIRKYLRLQPLDVHYKIFFSNGEALRVYRDQEKTKQAFEQIEPGSAAKYDLFIAHVSRTYQTVKPLLFKSFTLKDLFNPQYWPLLWKLKPFQTYWQVAKQYFKDERLCFIMTFEAMFIGVSPYKTPSFYSIITYSDHVQKIYHPLGGMYRIPKSLESLCLEKGVKFFYESEIAEIVPKANHLELRSNGLCIPADKVVINADYAYAQEKLLKRKLARYQYSCSVLLFYFGLKKRIEGLEHHNIFFSGNIGKNLHQIFYTHEAPEDPSFYIHVPTVTDPDLAPKGKDIFYVLIPVPNLHRDPNYFNEAVEQQLRRYILSKIQETVQVDIEPLIEIEHRFYPRDFITRYNILHGATFGLAHSLMQSAFFRPANRDPRISGLYYVGASTQPGGGLPPVLASSRVVADMIGT